jgi:predicted Zn-dependent protease
MGHVQHRHILQGVITHLFTSQAISMIFSAGQSSMADWAKYFFNMSFTRSQEAQADEEGLRRLQKAHVDNRGFRQFFERMEKSETALAFISDHPANTERMQMVEGFDNQNVKPIMTRDEWMILKSYCDEK